MAYGNVPCMLFTFQSEIFRAVVVVFVVVRERAKCFLPKFRQVQPMGCLFCRHWALSIHAVAHAR